SGKVSLLRSSNYVGDWQLTGELQFDADNELGDSGNDISISGGTMHTAGTMTLAATRSVQLNSGGGTFNVDVTTSVSIPGQVSGTGDLTKIGGGGLLISGSNNYTGKTTINAGSIISTSDANLGQLPASPVDGQLTICTET